MYLRCYASLIFRCAIQQMSIVDINDEDEYNYVRDLDIWTDSNLNEHGYASDTVL